MSVVLHIVPAPHDLVKHAEVESFLLATVDATHPVALELVATHHERRFLVRCRTEEHAEQVANHLHARYAQMQVSRIPDPCVLASNETVTGCRISRQGPEWVPLRAFPTDTEERDDPVLHLFGTLMTVPDAVRVVTRLSLRPAPADWSTRHVRYSEESPLADARRSEQQARDRDRLHSESGGSLSAGFVGLVLVGVLALTALVHWGNQIPGWVRQDGQALLKGQAVHLTSAQWHQVLLVAGAVVLILLLLLAGVGLIARLFAPRMPTYDQEAVRAHLSHGAYQARLEVMVIGPQPGWHPPHVQRRRWLKLVTMLLLLPFYSDRLWRWWRFTEPDREARRIARKDRQRLLTTVTSAYRQYTAPRGASLEARPEPSWVVRWRLPDRVWGPALLGGWPPLLPERFTAPEVAALWHVPLGDRLADLAQVDQTHFRTLPVPLSLSRGGPVLGINTHAGRATPVCLPPDVLLGHLDLLAKSGKGKSTALIRLIVDLLNTHADVGLVVVDPHGDLIDDLLMRIPASRQAQVVVIDLADTAYPVGINPLDVTLGLDRDLVVSQLISIFKTIWSTSWGPRMEAAFEMGLKCLFEANQDLVQVGQAGIDRQYTVLDLMPFLALETWRTGVVLPNVRDPLLTSWWPMNLDAKTPRDKTEMVSPVLTKITKLLETRIARHILGQSRTTVPLGRLVADGAVILIRAPRGEVGEDIAAIMGAMLLGMCALAQQQLPGPARRTTRYVIDEFQTLPGIDWARLLSEGRKYGIRLALASQSFTLADILSPVLPRAVLANVDQHFFFGMSAADAERVAPELDGLVEVRDLVNLDAFTAYAKCTVNGVRQPPCTVAILPPGPGDPTRAARLRSASAVQYGTPVARVEAHLVRMLALVKPYLTPVVKRSPRGTGSGASPAPGSRGSSTPSSASAPPSSPSPGVGAAAVSSGATPTSALSSVRVIATAAAAVRTKGQRPRKARGRPS